ncbi:MAG: zf-HC2 domain-containing protein [Gammaproteobacteria bacterium]
MSCPKTQHLLQEYFADDLAPKASAEIDHHLQQCEHCSTELESLLLARTNLNGWQDERVPHWDRGTELFRREHGKQVPAEPFWNRWQWLPTAASFAMLCILILNTTVVSSEQGFSISFGAGASGSEQLSAQLDARLAEIANEQRQETQAALARLEARQDSNNVQLLQAVMEQTQQTTAENLERIYTIFEQQRIQDLQDMRAGYQQLVDSDYQTIQSLQQLAQYVSYDGNTR